MPKNNAAMVRKDPECPVTDLKQSSIDKHDDCANNVCRLKDSPMYPFKVASHGQIDEFQQLFHKTPSLLTQKDKKGWTCFHHAAHRGKLNIIHFLIQNDIDVNIRTEENDTALHLAVRNGRIEAVKDLLLSDADPNVLNDKDCSPLHTAVAINRPDIIQEMGLFSSCDMNIKGKHGGTPLHMAAYMNYPEAATALMEHGAKICQPCENGYYPIHIAAKCGSTACVEAIIKNGESKGYSRECMLSYSDKEANSPLHSAVNSADVDVVKLCLEFGARIDCVQEDGKSAFHLACAQGTLSIVKLMLSHHEKQNPSSYKEILELQDCLQMTPLHKAALFEHPDVVQFLIQSGSDLEALDSDRRTPMLLAAGSGGSGSLKCLLTAGSSLTATDSKKRNLLHSLVNLGQDIINTLENIFEKEDGKMLMNQKDVYGCTPVHLAAKHGNLALLGCLLKLGALINLRNNDEQSPLHFAARYGRANTVRKLLESPNGVNIINESDDRGKTALHIASEHGHVKVVTMLLRKGALLHKEFGGRTPLHLCSSNGYTHTMKALLSYHWNLLNQLDKSWNSALHSAADANHGKAADYLLSANCDYLQNKSEKYPLDICIENRNTEAALALVNHPRWEEILSVKVGEGLPYICPIQGLIQYLPVVFKAVLDRCHTLSDNNASPDTYWEKFDFQFLQADPVKLSEVQKMGGRYRQLKPLFSLNTMVEYGRVELLTHPVCLQYLRMKWRAYGSWLFAINILFYLSFLGCLTGVVIKLGSSDSFQPHTFALANTTIEVYPDEVEISSGLKLMMALMLGFLIINCMKEFLQMYQMGLGYWADPANYIEWTLYISSFVFLTPTLFFGNPPTNVQWHCGIIAICLVWMNFLLYLQRLEFVGIYVVMFLQILSTVMRVVAVFSILFIAFGLAFFILFSQNPRGGFSTPGLSIIHVVMMMMGDWDFGGLFVENLPSLPFPALSFLFLIVFVILMPILFINLLIGLAVGDIEMIQKDARRKKLAMQVDYHTELEQRLPAYFLAKVDKKEYIYRPNCTANFAHRGVAALKRIGSFYNLSKEDRNGNGDGLFSGNSSHDNARGLQEEINSLKRKIKDLQREANKQTDLLKLIVQKMEIISEADNFDEGVCTETESVRPCGGNLQINPKKETNTANQLLSKTRIQAKLALMKPKKA